MEICWLGLVNCRFFNLLANDYRSNNHSIREHFLGRQGIKEESVIFSSQKTGNLIPAFSIRQVYPGHGHQTAQFERKASETERFFQKNKDDEKIAFSKENKIDYFFFGPEEKKLIQFNPEEKNYLEKVFGNNEAAIYKVNY